MSKNDGPIVAILGEQARLLAERFFPKDQGKALRAAELIANAIRESLEEDRWRHIQNEEWGCLDCNAIYSRRETVHHGAAEMCPQCRKELLRADRMRLTQAESALKKLLNFRPKLPSRIAAELKSALRHISSFAD